MGLLTYQWQPPNVTTPAEAIMASLRMAQQERAQQAIEERAQEEHNLQIAQEARLAHAQQMKESFDAGTAARDDAKTASDISENTAQTGLLQQKTKELQDEGGTFNFTGGGPGGAPIGTVTDYGQQNDSTPDDASLGRGAYSVPTGAYDNALGPDSLAVSPDIEQKFKASGIKLGDPVHLTLADGTNVTRKWDDRTSDKLNGRFDFYSPGGPHPKRGMGVVGFAPATATAPIDPASALRPAPSGFSFGAGMDGPSTGAQPVSLPPLRMGAPVPAAASPVDNLAASLRSISGNFTKRDVAKALPSAIAAAIRPSRAGSGTGTAQPQTIGAVAEANGLHMDDAGNYVNDKGLVYDVSISSSGKGAAKPAKANDLKLTPDPNHDGYLFNAKGQIFRETDDGIFRVGGEFEKKRLEQSSDAQDYRKERNAQTDAEKASKAKVDQLTRDFDREVKKRNELEKLGYNTSSDPAKKQQFSEQQTRAEQALSLMHTARSDQDRLLNGFAAPATSPAPSAAKPAQGGYVPGKKYRGMTYLGGDPTDQANWQQ